jgi:hypothetical protein
VIIKGLELRGSRRVDGKPRGDVADTATPTPAVPS